MIKHFCDHCGQELDLGRNSPFNLADAYSVLKLNWEDGQKPSCDLCDDCKREMRQAFRTLLRKFSGECRQ